MFKSGFNLKLVLLIVVLILSALIPAKSFAADASKYREGLDEAGEERRIGTRYPIPTQETPFEQYNATGATTILASVATKLPHPATYTRVVTVVPLGGAVNYGPSSVPNDVLLNGYPFCIASGSEKTFVLGTSTPPLYFRAKTGTLELHRMEW